MEDPDRQVERRRAPNPPPRHNPHLRSASPLEKFVPNPKLKLSDPCREIPERRNVVGLAVGFPGFDAFSGSDLLIGSSTSRPRNIAGAGRARSKPDWNELEKISKGCRPWPWIGAQTCFQPSCVVTIIIRSPNSVVIQVATWRRGGFKMEKPPRERGDADRKNPALF